LNVSHNQIKTFANCPGTATKTNTRPRRRNQLVQTLPVRVLDVSYNRIAELTAEFLRSFCTQTLTLFVNHNSLRSLPIYLLGHCRCLQTLSLNYNHISQVDKPAEVPPGNSSIQTLSLQHNQIED